jgi:hypothetical protein
MSNPVGRPTSYRPEYCELVIELGRAGKSKAQMAAHIGVTRKTLDSWCDVFPEFLSAMECARDFALSWWEDQCEKGIWAGKQFNAPAWSRSMAARFPADYRENSRVELTGADGGPVEIDEKSAAAKIAKLMAVAQQRKEAAEGDDDLVG